MMQFIISPKRSTHGATNNHFDSCFSLSAFLTVSLYPSTRQPQYASFVNNRFWHFPSVSSLAHSKRRLQALQFKGGGLWDDSRELEGLNLWNDKMGLFSQRFQVYFPCGCGQYAAVRLLFEPATAEDCNGFWSEVYNEPEPLRVAPHVGELHVSGASCLPAES